MFNPLKVRLMRAVCGLDVRGLQISPSLFAYLLENLYFCTEDKHYPL